MFSFRLLPPLAGRLTSSVKSAFQFECAEHLPEGRVFHGGDVYTTPPVKTPGNVSPEGFQHGVNFRRGDVFASETGMTAGLYSRCGLVNNAVKIGCAILTAWIKQVPDLLFSYLRLTFSGVFLLLFLRSHYLPAG